MFKNMFRHFFVAFGAITYLLGAGMFLYQYLGVVNGWPGVFLSVVHDAAGDWWLDIDWTSPVIWTFVSCTAAMAAVYAVWKRDDQEGYRDPETQSQPGF